MWDAVRFTRADQVAQFFDLGQAGAAMLSDNESPEAFFVQLRQAGEIDDAIAFLAFALPRRAAIAWARDCVARSAASIKLKQADTAALSAAAAWLEDPTEERRWVAHGTAANASGAESLLAYSVYASGGSLAPPDCPQPVPPPPELTGRLVAGAVTIAAARVAVALIGETKAQFLDRGVEYASGQRQ